MKKMNINIFREGAEKIIEKYIINRKITDYEEMNEEIIELYKKTHSYNKYDEDDEEEYNEYFEDEINDLIFEILEENTDLT